MADVFFGLNRGDFKPVEPILRVRGEAWFARADARELPFVTLLTLC